MKTNDPRPSTWARTMPRMLARAVATMGLLGALLSTAVAFTLSSRRKDPYAEPVPVGIEVPIEAVRLRSADGIGFGAFHARGRAGGPAVLLVHGNGGDRTQLVPELLEFQALGAHVLAITVRAHGDADGTRNDFGYSARNEVVRGVEYLRAEHPGTPVVVFGHSLGAAAALFAARALGDSVDGYVLSAPYRDLDDAVARRTRLVLPAPLDALAHVGLRLAAYVVLPDYARIDPARAARRVPRASRMLVLVGSADERAPPGDAQAVARGAPHAHVEVFDGAGHESLLGFDRAHWRSVVAPFLAASRRTGGL